MHSSGKANEGSTADRASAESESDGKPATKVIDQKQKQKGLPTSDELKMDSILDQARDLPGSPFRDPTSTFHNAPNPKLNQG